MKLKINEITNILTSFEKTNSIDNNDNINDLNVESKEKFFKNASINFKFNQRFIDSNLNDTNYI